MRYKIAAQTQCGELQALNFYQAPMTALRCG